MNERQSLFDVANELYCAFFYKLMEVWHAEKCSIADFDRVLKVRAVGRQVVVGCWVGSFQFLVVRESWCCDAKNSVGSWWSYYFDDSTT